MGSRTYAAFCHAWGTIGAFSGSLAAPESKSGRLPLRKDGALDGPVASSHVRKTAPDSDPADTDSLNLSRRQSALALATK